MNNAKLIVISAPSGTGKSTLINYLLTQVQGLEFSISITSRSPRGKEQHGKEYYFVTAEEFRLKIQNGELAEYVEVYKDSFYGTLKTEIERITKSEKVVLFDLDVLGALKIKEQYHAQTLAVFIEPPSIEDLKKRLLARGTDSREVIDTRLERAEYEMTFAQKFDLVIVNDVLEQAQEKLVKEVNNFLQR